MEDSKLSKVYDYKCNICNKGYTSYQSMWNHNKKFHNIMSSKITHQNSNNTQNSSNISQNSSNISQNISTLIINKECNLICKYCNNKYSRIDNLKRHEQSCKEKINKQINEEIKLKEMDLLLKQQEEKNTKEKNLLLKQEKDILKLKFKLD
jgi:hypothetical protein